MIEAKKLAYADMYKYVGDPRFTQIPGEELISKDLAAQRAKLIDMNRPPARSFPPMCRRAQQARQLHP